jgi:hypothetical protein
MMTREVREFRVLYILLHSSFCGVCFWVIVALYVMVRIRVYGYEFLGA